MTTVIHEKACAKVNLWLEILGRRDDGYHEIETVMHEIDLADRLTLQKHHQVELQVSDPSVGTGEDNLAIKALRAVEAACGRRLPCLITLEKNIPAGGGLGGGSSDAAAVIRGLNRLFSLDLSHIEMEKVAAACGSDTAFFVNGQTALCRGRGELVEAISLRRSFTFVLVFPGLHVATSGIFRALQLTASPREPYDFLRGLSDADDSELPDLLFNRLEDAAMKEEPRLAELLGILKPRGFLMSGSGSTIFHLASDASAALRLAGELEESLGVRAQVVTSAIR